MYERRCGRRGGAKGVCGPSFPTDTCTGALALEGRAHGQKRAVNGAAERHLNHIAFIRKPRLALLALGLSCVTCKGEGRGVGMGQGGGREGGQRLLGFTMAAMVSLPSF